MKWFSRNSRPSRNWEEWPKLLDAVDQAHTDWQHAQRLVDMSETDEQIDDAIYYLQLTQKRYVYLLEQARRQYASVV